VEPLTNSPTLSMQGERTESEEREKYSNEFFVCKENFTPLLGLQANQQMELIDVCEDNFDRGFAVNSEYKVHFWSETLER